MTLVNLKKKFKLVEDYKEEKFLNEQSEAGYQFKSLSQNTYAFEEKDELNYYLIEFFFKELSNFQIKTYAKKGYELVYRLDSEVKGYYYFFKSKTPINDDDRNLKDRYQLLLNSKTRVDRFTSVIFLSSFTLFSYLYFKTYNHLYIIILFLIILLGSYFGYYYLETIKKLSEYVKMIEKGEDDYDGNDEGCREES